MITIDDAFIDRCFTDSEPRNRRPLALYFAIGLVLAFLFVPALSGRNWGLPTAATIGIPVLLSIAILGAVAYTTRRQKIHGRESSRAWESVQLNDWNAAERELTTAFRHPIASSAERCQALLALASIAERQKNFDAAINIYQRILIEQIGQPMQLQKTQIALVYAKFKNEELTDAIQMLDRLEKISMPLGLRAGVALVRLYQRVFMGQFEDALEDLADMRQLFRRFLSTRAGYAYALYAKAFHQLDRTDEAAAYWRDATLLVAPQRLLEAYPFVNPVQDRYAATENPL